MDFLMKVDGELLKLSTGALQLFSSSRASFRVSGRGGLTRDFESQRAQAGAVRELRFLILLVFVYSGLWLESAKGSGEYVFQPC